MISSNSKPVVLVMGATGQLGAIVADRLHEDDRITLRVTTRKHEQLKKLNERYGNTVFMDLDDPRIFDNTLQGVERLFILTGYTVAMLVQSKAIVDAAIKASVKHIVHLGVFTPKFDCYDPHFVWHQLIEAYIKVSGISYTFLHPNCFMQNFIGFYKMIRDGRVRFYANDKKVGWIALEDVGEAAAKILNEGPSKHGGKDYWFSTESLNIYEIAEIFCEVTGKEFLAEALPPEQFIKDLGVDRMSVDPYFIGVEEGFKQIVDGRMDYLADIRDDLPLLIGRKGMTLKDWAKFHKEEISQLSPNGFWGF